MEGVFETFHLVRDLGLSDPFLNHRNPASIGNPRPADGNAG
jgi:hypothetical protein